MASRSFLIRFIDVGLIVLFGFLMISGIDDSSQVELSTTSDAEQENHTDTDRVFVRVAIDADGTFRLLDPETEERLTDALHGHTALQAALREFQEQHAAKDQRIIVLIQPHEASIVQWTVDVMDVCDRLGLAKSLQTDLLAGGPGA